MLNEKVIKNNLKTEVLKGCRVDEYYYNYERNTLSKSGGMWYQQYGDIYISVEDTNMGQGIVATISKNDVEFSRSGITFNRPNKDFTVRTIPFTNVEDVAKFDKVVPLIGDGKVQCRILNFKINNRIRSAKNDKEIQRISTSKLDIAVDKDAWIYFIILKDGSLPIIVVTDTEVGFLGVDDDIDDIDIKDYAFKHSEEGFFNSYYHPYNFEVREIKTYENTIYDEPGNGILNQLKFSEEISEDGTEYTNSDGISVTIYKNAQFNGKIIKDVKFNDQCIACYIDNNISINNFTTYRHIMNKIGLDEIKKQENLNDNVATNNANPNIEGDKSHDFSDFIIDTLGCMYCTNGIVPVYDVESYYKIIDKYDPNNIIYYINRADDSYIDHIIAIRHTDKHVEEVFQVFKNGKVIYSVYTINHSKEICIELDVNPVIPFEYQSYNNGNIRWIRTSNNKSILGFNQNLIKCDEDGYIINSTINLGEDTKLSYNAFGVPKDL